MPSVIPVLLLELGLSASLEVLEPPDLTYQGATSQSLVAAVVEEACKIGVIYWIVWGRPRFDERMDGIVRARTMDADAPRVPTTRTRRDAQWLLRRAWSR